MLDSNYVVISKKFFSFLLEKYSSNLSSSDLKLIQKFWKTIFSNDIIMEIDKTVIKYIIYLYKNNFNNFFEILIKTIYDYLTYYDKLIKIMSYYNYTMIDPIVDVSFRFKDLFLYAEYYNDLLHHNNTLLYKFLTMNEFIDSFYVKSIFFSLRIQIEESYFAENSLAIWISIYKYQTKIRLHNVCFYLWPDRIFISSVQNFKPYYREYNNKNIPSLHNYTFSLLKLIWNRIGIRNIITYSDDNHCLSHEKNFYWIYNNIFLKRWFKLNEKKFFVGDIDKLAYRNVWNSSFLKLKNNLNRFLKKIW